LLRLTHSFKYLVGYRERVVSGAVSSSYFEQLPEFADKLRTTYNVDRNVLRQILFESALNEGELDREIADLYPDEDIDDALRMTSVEDFPDYLPFEGFDIDPDNETLNAYRFAAENPKARGFVEQNNDLNSLLPGGTVESARNAYLEAINTGALTPAQREALRYAGESRFLSDANYRSEAGAALDNLLEAYTDRYDVDYSQNLENVADILEQADEVIRPVEAGLGTRNTFLSYADSAAVSQDPLTTRIDRNTIQPGLPLRAANPAIREGYEAIRNTLPQTVEELNAQLETLRELRRARATEGTPNTFPIEGSSVLPQVEEAIAPSSSINESRRSYLLERANEQARDPNRNSLYQLQRDLRQETPIGLDARQTLRTLNMSPADIDPFFAPLASQDTVQRAFPGLELQLYDLREAMREEAVNEQARELNKFVEKHPEVGPYLQSFIKNPTPKIERDIKKLLPYLDLEQEISKPEARQIIYNRAMKEIGVEPSYLSEIEKDYTSGDTEKQKLARDRIAQLGYGKELQEGSSSSVSRRMPVVGGGGYATGEELRDAFSLINQRANEFERLTNTPATASLSSTAGPLALKNPNLEAVPSSAYFSYDPETGVATPDPAGDYGIRINTNSAPSRFRLGTDLGQGNEISRNVLNFLRDNPVTGRSSVSFETRTPTSDFDYSAKEIPAPVFEQMNKFMTENVLRNLRPGMLLENTPISTSDISRLREEQGKSLSESSTLRREDKFIGNQPNRRGAAYRSVGFGPLTDVNQQLLYMNSEGNIVPLQARRPAPSLTGRVDIVQPRPNDPLPLSLRAEVSQSREPLTAKAYYSVDPIVAVGLGGAHEFGHALRRTPSALLPGVADLIPSPEAIRTGYAQGPVAMGKQMGQEFIQSLPAAAGFAGGLATPIAAPLAPGIGAGLVGTAGTRALNEVVRQETGEGIVPKLRQFIGTAPRTGIAAQPRVGEQPLTAEIKPLTTAQKAEATRQVNRSETSAASGFT
jgi:hypothetical protein